MKEYKVLIIGGDSKIGSAIYISLKKKNFKVLKTTRRKILFQDEIHLDLLKLESAKSIFKLYHFEFIFLCASITSISYCETNPIEAFKLNVTKQIELINFLNNYNSFIIHFSTNLVFDGTKNNLHTNQIKCPKCNYGLQKSLLEDEILGISNLAIIRLTKVIDFKFALFRNWINDLKNNKEIFSLVDVKMAPVWIEDLIHFLNLFFTNPEVGIYHVSSSYDISYYDAISYIAREMNLNINLINPIKANDLNINYNMNFSNLIIDKNKENIFKKISPYTSIDNFIKFNHFD